MGPALPIIAGVGAGLNALINLLSGNDAKNLSQAQLAQALQLARETMGLQRELAGREEGQRQAERAQDAMNQNPVGHQQSRQLNALMSSVANRSTRSSFDNPGSGLNWNPADFASFFTDSARENAENAFHANVGAAAGGRYKPASGVGYAGATGPTTSTPLPALIKPWGPNPNIPPVLPSTNREPGGGGPRNRREHLSEFEDRVTGHFDPTGGVQDEDKRYGPRLGRTRRYGE